MTILITKLVTMSQLNPNLPEYVSKNGEGFFYSYKGFIKYTHYLKNTTVYCTFFSERVFP